MTTRPSSSRRQRGLSAAAAGEAIRQSSRAIVVLMLRWVKMQDVAVGEGFVALAADSSGRVQACPPGHVPDVLVDPALETPGYFRAPLRGLFPARLPAMFCAPSAGSGQVLSRRTRETGHPVLPCFVTQAVGMT